MLNPSLASLCTYFADKNDAIASADISTSTFCLSVQEFVLDFGLNHFVMINQQHADQGVIIESMNNNISWLEYKADYIITNQKHIGLLVFTADCVPLIIFDPMHQVVALVHAGWKGTVAGVLDRVINDLTKKYDSNIKDLIAIFGPSAKGCCYQVQDDLLEAVNRKEYAVWGTHDSIRWSKFVRQNNDIWYFDNSIFLQENLKKFGIRAHNIYTNNALCTICNVQFCSFRKSETKQLRQLSMVAIR